MLEFARSNGVGDGWNQVGPNMSGLQREACKRLSGFNLMNSTPGIDLTKMKKELNLQSRSFSECLQALRNRDSDPHKGT